MAGRKTFLAPGERARLALNLALRGYGWDQMAAELGVTRRTAMNLVRWAKIRAGIYRARATVGRPPFDEDQREPGCARCGLHGDDHVCLRGDATARKPWAA